MAFTYAGRFAQVAEKSDGTLLKNGSVSVYSPGTTTLITLYTDRTKGSTASNPVTTDAVSGMLAFYCDPGLYDLSGPGIALSNIAVTGDVSEFELANLVNANSGIAGLDAAKRIVTATAAVTVAAGANAGTSPPAPVVGTSKDQAGTITFGSGSGSPAAGAQVVVTFSTAWAAAPKAVIVTPNNAATQQLNPYVAAASTTAFTLSTQAAPTASQANTVYSFSYVVIG